ncbi:uncharacterized protein F5891DRAFT_1239331 [Suillus fuscotomentosus]|uniref:DUF6534 domain-containing protein n=1 Tax=Suillus fuscotomentosus TaxID=1912939 RepID=A0AAD4DMX3_9AGAM|nr:uncharacterized protein F5891DRAFT_1239331 [Suillus fuscotomentosus]KAG1884505.1 hypothetical protein F5891DRAFT_1239331 [Suillus fuscotomentosus]
MSDPSSPSPAEVENLIIIFMGFVFATFLYGLTFFQMYIYFSRYSNDYAWTKLLVGALFVLDTTSTSLVSDIPYHYLITMFDVSIEVLYPTPAFCIQYIFSAILTLITQSFFASRLHTVCGSFTNITSRSISLVVLLCAFISFVFGLISVGQFFQHGQLSTFALPSMPVRVFVDSEISHPELQIIAGISQGFAAVANIIIFIMMYWSLCPAHYLDMLQSVPEGVLENLAVLFVSRGLGLTIIQLVYLGTFVASPGKPYWIAVQMVTPRIYVNIVLGLLNAREVKHGVGLNEEDTLSGRHNSQNDVPGTLRFLNRKASHQAFCNGENSRGSEIEEASKSYASDQKLNLAQIEMQFGFALPQAVRELYLVVDGYEAESSAGCSDGLFFGLLEAVFEEWRFWREVDDDPQMGFRA